MAKGSETQRKVPLRDILTAFSACRSAANWPDGSPIPQPVRHLLLVLGSYYPNIYPSQQHLADDVGAHRVSVARWLKQLESAGLIRRTPGRTGRSTVYWLNLDVIRACSVAGSATVEPDDDGYPY